MIINLLCDNKKSWFWDTNKIFIEKLTELGHVVNIAKSEDELKEGDIAAFISSLKIVTKDGLSKNKSNVVPHPSNLPEGRGFAPITWEVLNDKNELYFTLFEANEKIDDGKIYYKENVQLSGNELAQDLREIQAEKTYELILRYVNEYPNVEGVEQNGDATYFPRRYPKDSELNINESLKSQFNLLRVVDNENYPAFFVIDGTKYILKIYKDDEK